MEEVCKSNKSAPCKTSAFRPRYGAPTALKGGGSNQLRNLDESLPLAAALLPALTDALYSAMLITYAQGFALLKKHYADLNLAAVARLWRGGCIIRAELLDDLVKAFDTDPSLANALLAPNIANCINPRLMQLRSIVSDAALAGLSLPGMMASLSYLDAYRSASPANLIAAQRDYFGAHGYERTDRPGTFHTEWITLHD